MLLQYKPNGNNDIHVPALTAAGAGAAGMSGKGKAGITSASSSCLFTETESFLRQNAGVSMANDGSLLGVSTGSFPLG